MKIWVAGVWALVFLPFFILNFYNFPAADDFWYSSILEREGFWGAQLHYYKNWSGRFVATALMSFNPVTFKSLLGYRLLSAFNILFLLAALWFCCRCLVQELKLPTKTLSVFSLLSLCIFAHWPGVVQGFYWMAGFINYTIPLSVLLFMAGFYLRQQVRNQWDFKGLLLLSLMCLFVVGSNETLMFQLCVFWLFCTVFYFLHKSPKWKAHFVYLMVSGIGAIFVYLAPGNSVRESRFEGLNPFHALFKSYAVSAVEHSVQFLSLPLLFLSLIAVGWVLEHRHQLNFQFLEKWRARYLWLGYLSLLACGFLPSQISMGGNPRSRVDNMFYVMVVLFLVFLAIHWAWNRKEKWAPIFVQKLFLQPRVLLLGFLFSVVVWDNVFWAWQDVFVDGRTYHSANLYRQSQMETRPDHNHVFSSHSTRPISLFFADIGADAGHSLNQAYASFFGVASVRVDDE